VCRIQLEGKARTETERQRTNRPRQVERGILIKAESEKNILRESQRQRITLKQRNVRQYRDGREKGRGVVGAREKTKFQKRD
jgi:hypothetical protein